MEDALQSAQSWRWFTVMSGDLAAALAEFGPAEVVSLSRLQKFAGRALANNWTSIPHATHFDQADVTRLEELRGELNRSQQGARLTPLPFLIKAMVSALTAFPRFNASLDSGKDALVLKKYFHVRFAVENRARNFTH
jgi:pyruvate dehydrogenase E2 component (dihydrolipoamide acetyltransferase)